MGRAATLEQMARARDVARMTIERPITRENWPSIVEGFQTIGELEAFRITLLLEGKDTRSARRAIQAQKDIITGLREVPHKDTPPKGGKYGRTGRPIGSKDRKPRKMRSTTGGTHA